MDVAISIKSLTTILKSITHNGKQVKKTKNLILKLNIHLFLFLFKLLLTMMLMAIVVYMYTVIAFNFFRKFYASEEDGEVEQNCHDLATVNFFKIFQNIL